MSNLVTPMLTSVENSPTIDFYPHLRFPSSPCAILSKGKNDKICINETTEWNDLEHLVSRSTLIKTSTSNECSSTTHNRRIFTKNCLSSHDNAQIEEQSSSVHSQGSESNLLTFNSLTEHDKIINNIWNVTENASISSSKDCVNINMAYNDGSSIESMVSDKNSKFKSNFVVTKDATENDTMYTEECCNVANINDGNTNKLYTPLTLEPIKDNSQIKTFKNGSKAGHSRQWGSCGSAVTLQLNVDEKNIRSKFFLNINPLSAVYTSPDIIPASSPLNSTTTTNVVTVATAASMVPTTTTTEIRNTPCNQNNKLNRISQLSFEAEFDSDGRTHEQSTVDLRKIDSYIMAGQITRIELSYFKAIKPEEFLSFKWTGMSKHIHAPGIVAATRWFNQLNYWAQRIILDCTELNRRSEMLTYVIRIIKKLVDCFNNLSSGMALMSALEVECIYRLKQTWNTLSNKDRATFKRMEELFSSENNYEKLREHINSLKLPCLPYLGLYLTDLTYINIAHSKLSEFESQTKTDQINNILRTVSEFQQSKYDIRECTVLYRYLENQRYIEELQKLIEESNYRASMSLEPIIVEGYCQQTRQLQQQLQQPQQQQQQQDHSTVNAISPQKTPPAYACKHVLCGPSLQSPISPKPIVSSPHNEPVKEMLTQQNELPPRIDQNTDIPFDAVCGTIKMQLTGSSESGIIPLYRDNNGKEHAYEESLMMSSRCSDEDSVRASLLCGSARKSYLKKRSTSTSIRFKRDSSSSSRQQVSSKTGTLSSTSQSAMSDKDLLGQHSKSLLDDSYLDATLNDNCTGPGTMDVTTQGLTVGDNSIVSSKPKEAVCSPPIVRCSINKDFVDLKSKALAKRKVEYSNLVEIVHAAESAIRFSGQDKLCQHSDFVHCSETVIHPTEESLSITSDSRDQIKLVCQGVLSRKACVKNAKRSRFSMWIRNWMMLMMSKENAFLVFFENSQFRALERKDFKHKKCHVQDLKSVIVSRVRPSLDKNIFEQHTDLSQSSDDSDTKCCNIKKFFLIDKEYGTVYKFRDLSTKSRATHTKDRRVTAVATASDTDNDACDCTVLPCIGQMPSVSVWYRSLKSSINAVTCSRYENKDLIVLSDS